MKKKLFILTLSTFILCVAITFLAIPNSYASAQYNQDDYPQYQYDYLDKSYDMDFNADEFYIGIEPTSARSAFAGERLRTRTGWLTIETTIGTLGANAICNENGHFSVVSSQTIDFYRSEYVLWQPISQSLVIVLIILQIIILLFIIALFIASIVLIIQLIKRRKK